MDEHQPAGPDMANISDGPPQIVLDYTYVPAALISFTIFLGAFFTISPLASWYFVPTYSRISRYQKYDWNSRLISFVHSILVSCLGIYNAIYDWPTWEDPVWGDSYLPRLTVAITTGYIISDLVIILLGFPLKESIYYILHHLSVILAYSANMVFGPLTYFANARVIAELSTPCVNLRWMLDLTGMKEYRVYMINGFVMLGAFFLVRISIIPLYYYVLFKVFASGAYRRLHPWMIATCLIASVGLDSINVFWFTKMYRGARKMLRKKTTKPDNVRNRVKGE